MITETVISNASRSAAMANMTADEFTEECKIKSFCQYEIITQHIAMVQQKFSLSLTLHGRLQAFFKHFRSRVCDVSNDTHLFLSWNGENLSSGQVKHAAWNKTGLGNATTCTLVRKTAVSAVEQKRP